MDILPGQSYPLGATVLPGGVNFCVFSRNATAVDLLLFDQADDAQPAQLIHLDPDINRTFYYWHIFVKGLSAGQLYGYRVHGPYQPAHGLRFDGSKVLLDPYALVVSYGDNYSRAAAARPGDNCSQAMKGVIADPHDYDWEGDSPLQRPFSRTVIYELHVGGFTSHPNSGLPEELRGSYAGLIEKIPYLQELGITAVELLPVQQFDEQEAPNKLTNYWGYSTLAFFAPHRGYCSSSDPLGPINEFRNMVKALHQVGIEVILDVVFNHTAEGNHAGPILSFRGFENRAYYILSPENPAIYHNYSGCGNTLNANQSIVRRMIIDCLHYWVQEMHVDGFRFDLASVLARDERGTPLRSPPILWEIESDPILAGAKIIAEAWDAAGLYQVGSFVGHRWAEWNGIYRDDVRSFIKGDSSTIGRLAARIAGSRDIYPQADREPNRGINFVTCHDGFTLNDLVSYNHKHNDANLEGNRDGAHENFSWNCGIDGKTKDVAVETLRRQQIKNFLIVLFTSQGTPMLLMGDEVRHTQRGNNNAYCQDSEISWFDWSDLSRHADILRFTRCLLSFYWTHNIFHDESFWTEPGGPEIIWHGLKQYQPDWHKNSHSLAYELLNHQTGERILVMLNAFWEALNFDLPQLLPEKSWCRVADTALPSPEDFPEQPLKLPAMRGSYLVQSRSAVILKVSD